MVVIRLRREGTTNTPYYKVVVADQRSPRDGKFIEKIGAYDPNYDPPKFQIDDTRWSYWVKVGATPSETVAGLQKRATKKPAAKA